MMFDLGYEHFFFINISKPSVISRKNLLFSNTINRATSSTIIYSIIQTAVAHDLISEKYLNAIKQEKAVIDLALGEEL